MRKLLSKRVIKIFFGLLLIFTLFQFLAGCFSFRMSKSEVEDYFKNETYKPEIKYYQIDGRKINYAEISIKDDIPTVIFFHGAPGSWSAFIHFMRDSALINNAKIISVDRPGYGHSNFGSSVVSLEEQVYLLKPLLEKEGNKQLILVGHSLGGPIIARIAMDYPEYADALVMVAPSIDPKLEPDEDWFRFPLRTPFLRWILPTSFRVTNDEIYFLEEELEEMLPKWKDLSIPVTVIQGGKDNLVSPKNAEFAQEMIINSNVDIVLVEEMNHFVPWHRPDLIRNAILKQIDQLKQKANDMSHSLSEPSN